MLLNWRRTLILKPGPTTLQKPESLCGQTTPGGEHLATSMPQSVKLREGHVGISKSKRSAGTDSTTSASGARRERASLPNLCFLSDRAINFCSDFGGRQTCNYIGFGGESPLKTGQTTSLSVSLSLFFSLRSTWRRIYLLSF